ncbi:Glycosyl transferase family 2 [Monaibacterium marinum]|uniref:Glycosyl transferase family 2 n=1 Tax=Pontivivens marinum TaxID=1690039 RepID=A0A2C9CPE8_9RHOB|nr:glycosyltransferase family 2 protein [Monaibacterium marinum]SOH93080.1 Glycosyl transferase family 2 [Monaibacterium marinum]
MKITAILNQLLLRARRRRLQLRARRKRRELKPVQNRTANIRPEDILVFTTQRNELDRLPYFLNYYRKIGCNHFVIVDNASTDGSREYLEEQDDVSLWHTDASYRSARFGCDWLNGLQALYAHGHWTLTVDVDEFLVYPHSDTRPLNAMTDWLDSSSVKSFSAMLLDMYSKGPISQTHYRRGQNPFDLLRWFDPGNYLIRKDRRHGNLWIQGGPRMRNVFATEPARAPALNKIPLVKWHRGYVYTSSTHSLLPRGLNRVFDEWGGEKPSGCLLHAKFLSLIGSKVDEELERKQHYAGGREYQAYQETIEQNGTFWTEGSVEYVGWRQLEGLGLMSSGSWI